ncbi:sugar-binding domain-containing protein [Mucilaginibacter sp. PAMB04168]|uniref:sugar-binding domain-containing protein n=1 Tax=Mucilaginibacter sp. PAMB04168 TaxID=3138567 RepID=UPI0031F6EA7C
MQFKWYSVIVLLLFGMVEAQGQINPRKVELFNSNWRFYLGDDNAAKNEVYNDNAWRQLSLPHDWSIEGAFNEKNPTTQAGGGLPAGIGWYRKNFMVPASAQGKNVFIDFDGVYCNSEVWINGHYLGKRPNGYISFQYDLTPYLHYGTQANVIAVKVDNSAQPNSRWYTGSGIYRNVWLSTVAKSYIPQWGSFVTTHVNKANAIVRMQTQIVKHQEGLYLKATVYTPAGQLVNSITTPVESNDTAVTINQNIVVGQPKLWSVDNPNLYKVVLQVLAGKQVVDKYQTYIGIRTFNFDKDEGFSLNDEPMKIKGVCMHHDLGALGAAINVRAMERQLEILKAMGCNAIRTAHNPPAPEFLDLCDRMGFLVMDEAFDMWRKKKNKQDYYQHFDKWHKRDLEDQVKRDRNHPSIIIWSIGNEIREQFDSTGISITRELVGIVKGLDGTRYVTSALSEADPKKNFIYQSGALDILGFNYHPETYTNFPKIYLGQKFLATETISGYATRGFYDTPTDSTRHWPTSSKEKFTQGNPEFAVTAYDNVAAYWGSTHEETWKIIKKYDYLSGEFVWSGFDFIGEPVPYPWPARSSYYGIIDLAGFPKDVYYMYQSEWTDKPVLHLLPHWNWQSGKTVDVWAYYNNADEVELYLNGRSLGVQKKQGEDLHISWKVPFEPGTLRAVSRKNGRIVLTKEIRTAAEPARIELLADRKLLKSNGTDLSFVTVRVLDKNGNLVPDADNQINFTVTGKGALAGVDNGAQSSMEPFKASQRKAFHGMCLAIVQAAQSSGVVTITARADGLLPASVVVRVR